MDIYYLGLSSFLLKGKKASVVTDPYDSKMVGLKYPKTEANIVTVSHDHGDHNAVTNVSGNSIVFSGPGEYESMGVSFIGLPSFHDDKKGKLRGKNIIFLIEMDGLRIGHFGDIGHKLSEKLLGEIGDLDVAMLPVGGEYTVDTDTASEMARSIGARVTIPMHFQMPGLNKKVFGKLTSVDDFLTKSGFQVEKMRKLTIKPEFITEDQKVVLLEKR
ncbi:MBL fold metallo-hydrolase [Patescibacteria group bacterium]